jgi:hypothetical protein
MKICIRPQLRHIRRKRLDRMAFYVSRTVRTVSTVFRDLAPLWGGWPNRSEVRVSERFRTVLPILTLRQNLPTTGSGSYASRIALRG